MVGALTADCSRYVVATVIWGAFHRFHERQLTDRHKDPDLDAPSFLNWPGNTLFASKLALTALAYALILLYVSRLWFAAAPSV